MKRTSVIIALLCSATLGVNAPAAVPNDTCTTAEIIEHIDFITPIDNSLAVADGGPAGSCNSNAAVQMQNDVWYKFLSTGTGTVSANIMTAPYDGIIVLYQGNLCGSLTELKCADQPDDPAEFDFAVNPSQTYWLQIGDWGTVPGGGNTTISLFFDTQLGPVDYVSRYDNTPGVTIDGVASKAEWADSAVLDLGMPVHLRHDDSFLYMLIDFTDDTFDEIDDYFWLTFDCDSDGLITPDVDLNFGLVPGTYNTLGVQKYKGPDVWTPMDTGINSSGARGFGPTLNSNTDHNFWELKLDFAEINTAVNKTLRLGLRVSSDKPALTISTPQDFPQNFTDLVELLLLKPDSIVDECSAVGTGGDRADIRGIHFTTDKSFNSASVRMAAAAEGIYQFDVQIRNAPGFFGPPLETVHVETYLPDTSALPFADVEFGFPMIESYGDQQYTLKFVNINGPGLMYIETPGIGEFPCPQAYITTDNTSELASQRASATGFRLLAKSCYAPVTGDLNEDCKNDLADVAIMAQNWLVCHRYPPSDCMD
jgi:hypothetical protein